MAGFIDRREYMAAQIIRRFLHQHTATWLEWDDHDLLGIIEHWKDQYYEWRDKLLDAEFGSEFG